MQQIVTKRGGFSQTSAKPDSNHIDHAAPWEQRHVEEMMTLDKSAASYGETPKRREQELDRRYGEIGIPAVAAAVRCQSFGGNAPVRSSARDERSDKAA